MAISINVPVTGLGASGGVGAMTGNIWTLVAGFQATGRTSDVQSFGFKTEPPLADGNIASGTTATNIVLGETVVLAFCGIYRLTTVLAGGVVESRDIPPGTGCAVTALNVETAFSSVPPVGAPWFLNEVWLRMNGRIVAATTTTVTLDQVWDQDICMYFTITVVMADGSLETSELLPNPGNSNTVEVLTPFSVAPPVGGEWWIRESDRPYFDYEGDAPGVQGIGELGTVTIYIDAPLQFTPIGVFGTGVVGAATVTGTADVSPLGVEGIGEVGAAGFASTVTATDTGTAATGSVGDVTVSIGAAAPVSGVFGTGSVGAVTITLAANVDVVGAGATGSFGDVTVETAGNITASVVGLFAVGELGTSTVQGGSNTGSGPQPPANSGYEADAQLGSVVVALDVPANVSGVAAVGELGGVEVTFGQDVMAFGLGGIGAAGISEFASADDVAPAGVSAVGQVGSVSVRTVQRRDRMLKLQAGPRELESLSEEVF